MVEPDNILDLLERVIIFCGPIAAIIWAAVKAENPQEFGVLMTAGFAITGIAWASFRWWLHRLR